jgi:hypothetical protein
MASYADPKLEEIARGICQPLARRESVTAYDIAAKMGNRNFSENIRAADNAMRKMHGLYRESDGLTWVYSTKGGTLHGAWLKKSRTDGR